MTLRSRIVVSLVFAVLVGLCTIESARRNVQSAVYSYDGKQSTELRMQSIRKAISVYQKRTGHPPRDKTELALLTYATGSYSTIDLLDYWGHPFVYHVDGDHYTLMSLGADGKPGGGWFNADLVSGPIASPQAIRIPYRDFVLSAVFPEVAFWSCLTAAVCFCIAWVGTRKAEKIDAATVVTLVIVGLAAVGASGIMTALHVLPSDH